MKSGEVVCKVFFMYEYGCILSFSFAVTAGDHWNPLGTVTVVLHLKLQLVYSVSRPADISVAIFHGCSYAASYTRNVMSTFLILLRPCSNWSVVSLRFRALEQPYCEGKSWKVKAKCQAYSQQGADTEIIFSGVFLSMLHSKIPAANEHKMVSWLQNGTWAVCVKSIYG